MPDREIIQFIVIEIARGKHIGLGRQRFNVAPRINEYITRNVDGVGQAYKVLAVIHPFEPSETAGDLYVERIGTDLELRDLIAGA
jgi:hypothetical protein